MNHEPQTFVDLQESGNAQSQLVLQAIARHANWDTGRCYPSVRTLSRMAKCSEKTARRHLKKLKDDGFIAYTPSTRQDGSQGANEIVLIGYAEWIASNRAGGNVPKPKKTRRYDERSLGNDNDDPLGQSDQGPPGQCDQPPGHVPTSPPGQVDQGPLDTAVTTPPGQQVTTLMNTSLEQVSEEARERASEVSNFDLEGKGVRDRLRHALGENVFKSWFADVTFARQLSTVIVEAPSRVIRNWLQRQYDGAILAACRAEWPEVTSTKIVSNDNAAAGTARASR